MPNFLRSRTLTQTACFLLFEYRIFSLFPLISLIKKSYILPWLDRHLDTRETNFQRRLDELSAFLKWGKNKGGKKRGKANQTAEIRRGLEAKMACFPQKISVGQKSKAFLSLDCGVGARRKKKHKMKKKAFLSPLFCA